MPLPVKLKGQISRKVAGLPSHLPEHPSAGIGTFWYSVTGEQFQYCSLAGCRGFTGPVPPPLWI